MAGPAVDHNRVVVPGGSLDGSTRVAGSVAARPSEDKKEKKKKKTKNAVSHQVHVFGGRG